MDIKKYDKKKKDGWKVNFSKLALEYNNIYVTPQGETGQKSLEARNELWLSDDPTWNYLSNGFYS